MSSSLDKEVSTGRKGGNPFPDVPEEPSLECAPPLLPQSLTVLLDTTNECNLRCRMCHFSLEQVARHSKSPMSLKTFEKIAQQVFPFAHTIVLSAAAEPLIHPHFQEMLTIAAAYRPQHLKFLTNAQRLTPQIALHCIRSGVTEIHVSIDGATPATYEWVRSRADFQRLIDNLEMLQHLKRDRQSPLPLVQFNITLMRRNIVELSELARLASRLGVERLACRHLVLLAGLQMENESLFADKHWANEQMARQLPEIVEQGIGLVHFPDFFNEEDQNAFMTSGHRKHSKDGYAAPVSLSQRPEWSKWQCLPPRWRWRIQSIRHRHRRNRDVRYPIGAIDNPGQSFVSCSKGRRFSGWALHRSGIERIAVCRKPLPGEKPRRTNILGLVPIGEAKRQNGLRPDLMACFPGFPEMVQAGWAFPLSKAMLPSAFERVSLFVIAWGRNGSYSILGKRIVLLDNAECRPAECYCRKPFENVYIDSSANVYPHADCLHCRPFGSLSRGESFPTIWYGEAYQQLRRQIILGELPGMCRSCPDFINHRVDDPVLFTPRNVE